MWSFNNKYWSFLKIAIFRSIRTFVSVAYVRLGCARQIHLCLGPFLLRIVWPGSDIPKEVCAYPYKKKKPRQQSLFSSGHTSAVPSELGRSENPRYGLLVEMWYPPPQIEEGHSDLDCRIVSKKDFQTSFIGQEHLVVWYLYVVANGCLMDNPK